ncbi:MAG: DnaA/Hda family protein [Bacteroidetes bacterium]|nr:DnaA/Hda family protein [Bacteroidota bacterium]
MKPNQKYKLYGSIEALDYETGFVTPIFKSGENLFMQVTDNNQTIQDFVIVPIYFQHSKINPINTTIEKSAGEECLFGFKWKDNIEYKESGKLASFFKNKLPCIEINSYLEEQLVDFIREFALDSDITNSDHSNNLIKAKYYWSKCLDKLENVFPETIKLWGQLIVAKEFEDDTLYLEFNSDLVENYFADHLIIYLKNLMYDEFNIEIKKYKPILKATLVKFIGFYEICKRLIIKEQLQISSERSLFKIKNHQDYYDTNKYFNFSNLIECDNNEYAIKEFNIWHNLNSSPQRNTFIIKGTAGSGKSHLLSAISNQITKEKNVILNYIDAAEFSLFISECSYEKKMNLFFSYVFRNDYILIDDAHFLENDKGLLAALTYIRKLGKKLILSYLIENDKQEIDDKLPYLNPQVVYLKIPTKGDKEKIINFKQSGLKYKAGNYIIDKLCKSPTNNIRELEITFSRLLINSLSFSEIIHCKNNDRIFFSHNHDQKFLFSSIKIETLRHFHSKKIKNKDLKNKDGSYILNFAFFIFDLINETNKVSPTDKLYAFGKKYYTYTRQYSFFRNLQIIIENKKLLKCVVDIYEKLIRQSVQQ